MNTAARSALLVVSASALAAVIVHSSLAAPASASAGATAVPASVRFLRAQSVDLVGRFDEHGASFRVDGRSVGISTARIGRASAMRELRAAPPLGVLDEVRSARAEGVVEWWRVARLGLEHGYDIATRPEGEGALVVELRVTGLTPVQARGGIELRDGGHARLRYDGLHVYDARGRALASKLSTREGGLQIEVDDRGAAYPIVIDPLLMPTLSFRWALSPQPGEWFGSAVGVSSDVVVVGAPAYDRSNALEHTDEGRAFAFNPGDAQAYALPRTATRVDGSDFGTAVAVDGARFVIGAPGESFQAAPAESNEGAAYFYERTSTTTWSELPLRLSAQEAAFGDKFGSAVAIDGDVVAVGAPGRDSGAGIVYLFSDVSGTMTMTGSVAAPEPAAGQKFGMMLALEGDTLVVGAPGTTMAPGAVYLYTREADGTFAFLKTLDRAPLSVSISGDSIAIGGGNAVQIFDRTDGVWPDEESQTVIASYSLPGDFGKSAAISGDLLLVGDYGQPSNTMDRRGQAELFYRSPATGVWTSHATLNPVPEADDLFGWHVALDGGVGVVGATGEDGTGGAIIFNFRLAQGTSCRADSAGLCEHGFCVDGICCEVACDGACHACSEVRGSSADGICGVRSASSVCRPAADSCDLVEVCDGATYVCPADARMDACIPPDAGGTVGEPPAVPREQLSCTCQVAGRGGAAGALPSAFLVLMALGVALARSRSRRPASSRRGGRRG